MFDMDSSKPCVRIFLAVLSHVFKQSTGIFVQYAADESLVWDTFTGCFALQGKKVIILKYGCLSVTIHHIRKMAIQRHWIPAFAGMTEKINNLL